MRHLPHTTHPEQSALTGHGEQRRIASANPSKQLTMNETKRMRSTWIVILLFAAAFAVRAVGLFRGFDAGGSYHPDVAKQIRAVHNYLDGRYIWYIGSLAYDGYPYGLNHVDEWLIRATWPAAQTIVTLVNPGSAMPDRPDLIQLYYIVHALRVLYGLAALGLFLWTLRRIGVSPPILWFWLLLAATAPILSTVTHFGTGDIGTDLFVMAALACLAHARDGAPRAGPFFACGIALGMAFSCKYHGILGGLAPGLYLLLAPITWRRRFQLGGWLTAGVLLGFVILTPHIFIHFERTLKNIWLNFHYIKNYGVPESFRALPLGERLSISLTKNIPVVVHAMGIGTLLLAVIAALIALPRALRLRTHGAAWDLAVIAMPFVALALALAGKPALQPFHFSFLPLPFLLGAASTWRKPVGGVKILLAILMLWAAGEHVVAQRHEWYYWSREEIKELADRLGRELVRPEVEPSEARAIATLAIEGTGLPVFRNRPQVVRVPHGKEWALHPNDLLPATPWSASHTWIFTDLPAFPRETRLFVARAGSSTKRYAVQKSSVSNLMVTLTAGARESHVKLQVGRITQRLLLPPGESRSFPFVNAAGEPIEHARFSGRLHRVVVTARGAPVLVRLGSVPDTLPPDDRRDRKLNRAQFLSGVRGPSAGSLAIMRDAVLTPGRYAIDVMADASAPPIALRIDNQLLKHPQTIHRQPLEWRDGVWRAEWEHAAADLFSILSLEFATNTPASVRWSVRPLAARPVEPPAPAPAWTPAFSFGGTTWTLGNITMPTQIRRGDALRLTLQLEASPAGLESLADYSAFLHLLDAHQKQVFAADIRLAAIPSRFSADVPAQDLGRIDLPPGRYEVRFGIYNLFDMERVKPDTRHKRDRRVVAGELVVE